MNCYKFTIYQYVPRLASLWTVSVPTLIFFLFIAERNDWVYIKTSVGFMRWKREQSSNSTWKISPNCVRLVTHINNKKNRSIEIRGKSEILNLLCYMYLQKKFEHVPAARSQIIHCYMQTLKELSIFTWSYIYSLGCCWL